MQEAVIDLTVDVIDLIVDEGQEEKPKPQRRLMLFEPMSISDTEDDLYVCLVIFD